LIAVLKKKLPFIIVPVALGTILVLYGSTILTWLLQGQIGVQKQDTAQVVLMTPTPSDKPLTDVHYCRDTEPLYTLGHEADTAVASKIQSFVNFDTGGMTFTASYIASSSYEYNILSFSIRSVAKKVVPPPVLVYGSDPFKNKLLKEAYDKAYASYQVSSAAQEKSLHDLRVEVHQDAEKVAAMAEVNDSKASDPMGCISQASQEFKSSQGNTVKELVIASTMFSNVPPQNAGTISLPHVHVKLIFRTCLLSTAAACQADTANWERFFKHAGAASFQELDPIQSQLPGSFTL